MYYCVKQETQENKKDLALIPSAMIYTTVAISLAERMFVSPGVKRKTANIPAHGAVGLSLCPSARKLTY